MSNDWQLPEGKISELLKAVPEKVVSEEESEVLTAMPVNHHEEVSVGGDTVSVTSDACDFVSGDW